MSYLIGQFFGLMTTVCSLILPFLKKKWQFLLVNISINVLVILNMALIGQFGSAIFLCLVAIAQSTLALFRTKHNGVVSIPEAIIFTVLYVGGGLFGIVTAPGFEWVVNYRNLLELLPIMGALCQMICVFVRDEQTTRKWVLCNALFWMAYSAAVGSSVFFNDLLTAISTVTALYKYRKQPEKGAV